MNINFDYWLNLSIAYGIKLIFAIAIFIIGKWVSKWLVDISKKLMVKAKVEQTLIIFLGNLIYALLMVFVVLASLSKLGINTTSFIAILGALGLAVGLALQGSLANVGAAVLIIIFKPFRVGDFVDAGGASGSVEEINMFSTILRSPDNKIIILPNSAIVGSKIINYSAKPLRRVDWVFGIGYEDDLRKAKSVLENIIQSHEKILKDPKPLIAVSELADSSVNFTVRGWVRTQDYWDVYFDIIEKVKLTFDQERISIPYPQLDIHQK
ncbi:mechanosensitive ion channel family protein [Hippea maritima]|uniref:MscS Mechanosensitive ion channel n=1 Tax=Hippea maritima (strain ATCC 700847 / DSM 10411 / MH2) TaxID=760142 RepID=F2LTN4_HIPMA|nr:mechanosensitive ion channel domain-containing protein [Hippea maritima]AEA33359.1 MscS Mechanosensitive ion channel [Hippea maritima DSM 10411]